METQLLRDKDQFPDSDVLRHALGKCYPAMQTLTELITGPDYGLVMEWRFYHDGKAWLCKVSGKKKTVFWLSVWDGFFKTSFYLTGKYAPGVAALDIDPKLKDDFYSRAPVGKLLPMVILVHKKEQVKEVLKMIDYKIHLK